MVTRHRYPIRAMAADYVRAVAGMALAFGPLTFSNIASVMVYILATLGTLFLAFGMRTVLRHMTRVDVSADQIRFEGPIGAELRWRDLDAMTLNYYSTHRDRKGGWMQLTLKGGGRKVKLVSTIERFPEIASRAVIAARANGLELDEVTLSNLAALDRTPGEPAAGA